MPRVSAIATPTAHLVGPGKLKVLNGHLAFSAKGQGPLRLDPATLTTLLCYGAVGITDEAFQLLFEHNVEVAWLTPGGHRCRGRLVRSDPPTTALRVLQHQAFAELAWCRTWAAHLVAGKIESQIQAARHYQRHGTPAAGTTAQHLQALLEQCPGATSVEQLRGLEGAASAAWFDLLGQLLLPPWTFSSRTRRPPRDPVNALLSLGYTWLITRVVARCEAAGLEVYVGGLHEYRAGRPSLACDLMEPLRLPAVDRWVLALCNQSQVVPADFRSHGDGILLQPERFGTILQTWELHWQEQQQEQTLTSWLTTLMQALRQRQSQTPGPG